MKPTDTPARKCSQCQEPSPHTATAHTLIGDRHGWRCTKIVGDDGKPALKWFCPACWSKQKVGKGTTPNP
jgi:hypothetical protein